MKLISSIFVILIIVFGWIIYTKQIRSYVVATGSMQPAIPIKTLIVTIPSKTYAIGDISSYKDTIDRVITHRIVGIKDYQVGKLYYFKGDANKFNDPEPVSSKEILGKAYVLISGDLWTNKVLVLMIYIIAGFLIGKLAISFLKTFGTI